MGDPGDENRKNCLRRKHSVSGASHRNPIQRPGKDEKTTLNEGNLFL